MITFNAVRKVCFKFFHVQPTPPIRLCVTEWHFLWRKNMTFLNTLHVYRGAVCLCSQRIFGFNDQRIVHWDVGGGYRVEF